MKNITKLLIVIDIISHYKKEGLQLWFLLKIVSHKPSLSKLEYKRYIL